MQQVWIMKYGEPDVLQVQRAPDPDPGPGMVRIAVEAAGVNFADLMGRIGLYPDAPPAPYVPGYEVAGRVDALGEGAEGVVIGDPVLALTRFGGYSESVCVPAAYVFKRPAALPVEQAAGLLVPGFTAYAALVELARVREGDHVLIHGAGGGVGLMSVGIARHLGATIYGTASPHKHDLLRERGVDHPIDYRNEDVHEVIMRLTDGRGVDVVLDPIGGASWMRSFRMLAPMGQMVVYGVSALTPGRKRSLLSVAKFALRTPWLAFNPPALANANRAVSGLNLGQLWDEHALLRTGGDALLAWTSEGVLDVHVDRTFPLADAAEAHRYIHARRNTGKVILTM